MECTDSGKKYPVLYAKRTKNHEDFDDRDRLNIDIDFMYPVTATELLRKIIPSYNDGLTAAQCYNNYNWMYGEQVTKDTIEDVYWIYTHSKIDCWLNGQRKSKSDYIPYDFDGTIDDFKELCDQSIFRTRTNAKPLALYDKKPLVKDSKLTKKVLFSLKNGTQLLLNPETVEEVQILQ